MKIKRPWLHHVIILGYALAPLANFAIFSIFSPYPLSYVFKNFFNFFGVFGTIVLATEPFVALALYMVRKESFYLFIAHAILCLVQNILSLAHSSNYYNLGILLGSITLLAIVVFIIQRDFRAPYMHILPRSWRLDKRRDIEVGINVNNKKYMTGDISLTGVFIRNIDLEPGDEVKINIDAFDFSTTASVVRVDETGSGLRFHDLQKEQIKNLQKQVSQYYN